MLPAAAAVLAAGHRLRGVIERTPIVPSRALSVRTGADVHLKLGNIQYRRGVLADARQSWERALAIEPTNRIVRANLESLRARSEQGATFAFAVAGDNGA